jgi:hypothetical protein
VNPHGPAALRVAVQHFHDDLREAIRATGARKTQLRAQADQLAGMVSAYAVVSGSWAGPPAAQHSYPHPPWASVYAREEFGIDFAKLAELIMKVR